MIDNMTTRGAEGLKRRFTVTVGPQVTDSVDRLRGMVPRSRIVELALARYIEHERHENKKPTMRKETL
jgi:metal-responsive CopG/Arc/MetJ family transcriptional regulator